MAAPPADGHLDRLRGRLRDCAEVLDRQHAAILAGRESEMAELGGLERQAVSEIEALLRALAARSGSVEEASELLRDVLERNRRNREALQAAMLRTRRMIVARRARLGTPSVYADGGGPLLFDLRS